MIHLPSEYQKDIPVGEALDIVLDIMDGEDNLLNCMETIKQTSEVKPLTMGDFETYNAYNTVFVKMADMFKPL